MNSRIKTFDKNGDSFWKSLILPVLIFLCLLLFLYAGIGNASAASDEESRLILQNAVLRATVQCYAIEGMYPPNINYLEDNYGVIYDHERFIVHYEVFAGNILPDITVIDSSM
ncbi:hypothetical protein [Desulfitobacterium sp. PCE1]|uniref:hypothetical protein n=1 Tax=Desulfitobacterium sp. PCE1 TaxID=146907 RepID=UPI0003824C3A|nr:hypothetical protein [Desulfitobacterium sp. PCE1]